MSTSLTCFSLSTAIVDVPVWKPPTPKKNAKAFGSSRIASCEWYELKLPNCIDFDKPGMYLHSVLIMTLIMSYHSVPIYDASQKPFLFRQEDFVGIPSLPLYKREGKIADLPVDAIVSVFFAMSSYPKRAAGCPPTPSRSSASFNDILSLNIHFVIYYGVIRHEN